MGVSGSDGGFVMDTGFGAGGGLAGVWYSLLMATGTGRMDVGLVGGGLVSRETPSDGRATARIMSAGSVWGGAASRPNANLPISQVYLTAMPAGVLTSQGLA